MSDHDCKKSMAALLDHLENGAELQAGAEAELRHCTACSEVLRRAHRLGGLLEMPETEMREPGDHDHVAAAVVSEVSRRRRSRLFWSAFAIVVASVGYGLFTATHATLHHPTAVGLLLSLIFAGPMLLLMVSIRSASGGKVFKRLEGRQVSGVCRGLSEALMVPAWILRTAFVGFVYMNGAGLLIYLLLDFVLPIHPADRAKLLRFRFARWWEAHTG
jgi:phage shock protein PspC (stress-responsive transcriptional regulator)